MTTLQKILLTSSLCIAPALILAQGPLTQADLTKPLGNDWPTYSGDYTGRRYSSLKQVNQQNVKDLTLAWVGTLSAGPGGGGAPAAGGVGGGGRGGGGGGGPPPTA